MKAVPLRISPGADLRTTLENAAVDHAGDAGFVLAGIGSLSAARLRLAGHGDSRLISGDLEILTLCGTLSVDGAHLHMSIANAAGHVVGGHVDFGCAVRTTAEVLLVLMPEWSFRRERDAATGFAELVVSERDATAGKSQ